MINVDPYLQRLEWLKEWMGYSVDYGNPVVKVLDMFDRTGVLIVTTNPPNYLISFQNYCNYKQSLSKTTT